MNHLWTLPTKYVHLHNKNVYSLHTNIHTGDFYETAIHGDNRVKRIVDKADHEDLVSERKMVTLSNAAEFSKEVSCQLVLVSVPYLRPLFIFVSLCLVLSLFFASYLPLSLQC